jgi:hypothetical protein
MRFIPAGAGNTRAPTRCGGISFGSSPRVRGIRPWDQECSRCSPVHPRGCGEYLFAGSAASRSRGSSPRVRGIPRPPRARPGGLRFIPAGAGNTWRGSTERWSTPVHPRGCGEYARMTNVQGAESRFIPAGAGNTEYSGRSQCVFPRFIPAGAGNTAWLWPLSLASPVHPRGCGEYVVASLNIAAAARFIPAGAGNT